MEISKKFGFNLPNRDGDDLADINEITQNFQLIEEKIPSNDDLEEAKDEAIQEATKNLILNYIEYEITEENEVNILRCDPSIEGDYIIPEKIEGYPVTSICRNFSATSQYGFLDCVNLNSISIPDTVELIGSNAFNNCVSLEKVHIGNGVRKIGGSAFGGCSALKSVYLPNVETIGTGAFESCANLEAVTVGRGLVVVGLFSFGETNLKDVYYEGSQDEWNDVVFESQNDVILNAKVHFNYDPTLTTKGYVDEALRDAIDQTYNPESENPQSGKAVAQAVKAKQDKGEWKLISEEVLDKDGAIEVNHSAYFNEFDLQINTLDVPPENCKAGTMMLFWKNSGAGIAFAGLTANNQPYLIIRFHGVLRNGLWEIVAYSRTTNWQAAENDKFSTFCNGTDLCTEPIKFLKLYPYGDTLKAGTKYKLFVKEVAE